MFYNGERFIIRGTHQPISPIHPSSCFPMVITFTIHRSISPLEFGSIKKRKVLFSNGDSFMKFGMQLPKMNALWCAGSYF